MSEIQSLTNQARDLERSLNSWNNIYVCLVAATVILAVLVFLAQFISLRKARNLASTQSLLNIAKDAQLLLDLKSKDVEIAHTNQLASGANERAAKAEEHLAGANERAAKAQEDAAKANLELERIRTPRTINQQDQLQMATQLKGFAGTPYDLSVGVDSESVSFMRTIQSLLHDAGWVQVAAKGPIGLNNSDPLIGISLNAGVYIEIDMGKTSDWLSAIDSLVGLLRTKNIAVQGNIAKTGVDSNAVHISIGKKP